LTSREHVNSQLRGVLDEAFARLVRTVRQTAGDDRDTARKHLLELFEVVGADDPRVAKARQQLMAALF
ncbi:MAG TPA: tetratricopeptide repeat protein, partial [Kribbellaceae bacterium]|nr:tetratricopeptide repeat protein [Kribbellaceae bacterium]